MKEFKICNNNHFFKSSVGYCPHCVLLSEESIYLNDSKNNISEIDKLKNIINDLNLKIESQNNIIKQLKNKVKKPNNNKSKKSEVLDALKYLKSKKTKTKKDKESIYSLEMVLKNM